MDYLTLQNIESLIINNLLAYRQLMLPDVCVLAVNRYGASLTPDGNTLIPPQDHLEIYHPQSFCEISLVDLIAAEITAGDIYAAEQLYWQYIATAIPDGVTLTINELAIVDISALEVLAVSPELQMQLNPEIPQYIAPTTPQTYQQNNDPRRTNPREHKPVDSKNSQTKITLSTIVLVAAALYVTYYFIVLSGKL